MERRFAEELARIVIEPLDDRKAGMLRTFCTNLGLATNCPCNACKRAGACATRQVLCWQVLREELKPILRLVLAHKWEDGVARGEFLGIAPSAAAACARLLAAERAGEISLSGYIDAIRGTVRAPREGAP